MKHLFVVMLPLQDVIGRPYTGHKTQFADTFVNQYVKCFALRPLPLDSFLRS